MSEKTKRTPTIHGKEIIIDKDKLKKILDERGLEYIEFHRKIEDDYKLDLSYKGFMSLLSNRSTWKLLYAHAIATALDIDYRDIFVVVDVDIDKTKNEKKKWKEKYQK